MSVKQNALFQIGIFYLFVCLVGWLSWEYFSNKFSPVWAILFSDLVMTLITFGFSLFKKNSSVYDAYWSVIPFLFVLMMLVHLGLRWDVLLIFGVVSFWSWRLTMNWVRSWPGFHHEDWRYINIAKQTGEYYPLANFFAIHLYPTVIVFLAMLPIFMAFDSFPNGNIGLIVGAIVSIIGVIFEVVADNQLVAYRNRSNPDLSQMLDTGLWGVIRHPNYLGEMLFWIGLAIMGTSYASPWYTWIGCTGMVAMFLFASIPMKENRMKERRPKAFEKYKTSVPMLIPIKSKK